MKPNLKSLNAKLLHFDGAIALTAEIISEIQGVSAPDKDGDCPFVDAYDGHRGWAWVMGTTRQQDRELRNIMIEVNYEPSSGGRLGKRTPRIDQLVEILSSIKEDVDFNCQVNFQFRKRLKPMSIIRLPIKYSDLPNMPFDSVQGLHLVKLDGKETKYEVFLDSTPDGTVILNVFFKYMSAIDPSVAGKILHEATKIASSFVATE